MRAYMRKEPIPSLEEAAPTFNRAQIMFLEDLLMNKGCMAALYNCRTVAEPEKCRACAVRLEGMVNTIRGLKAPVTH